MVETATRRQIVPVNTEPIAEEAIEAMPPIPDIPEAEVMRMLRPETGPIVPAGVPGVRPATMEQTEARALQQEPRVPIVAIAVAPIPVGVGAVPAVHIPPAGHTVVAAVGPTGGRAQAAEVEAATGVPEDPHVLQAVIEAVGAVVPQVVSEAAEAADVLPECVPAEAAVEAEEVVVVVAVAVDVLKFQYPNRLNSKS